MAKIFSMMVLALALAGATAWADEENYNGEEDGGAQCGCSCTGYDKKGNEISGSKSNIGVKGRIAQKDADEACLDVLRDVTKKKPAKAKADCGDECLE
jgi:hypothetical protein